MTAIVAGTLTSPTTQAAAEHVFGQAFRKGDVPAGFYAQVDIANSAVVPEKVWPDGSLKHAKVIVRAPLTANVPLQINFVKRSSPRSGTNLTAADIAAAAPNAYVDFGAFGRVNLSALLASPQRTKTSTPQMVECHYKGKPGTDPSLWAKFHVRLFAGGKVRIDAIWGNSYLDSTERVNKSYVPTVSIGGIVIYANGGAVLKHWAHARYFETAWIGGDPGVSFVPDMGYWDRTYLVENLWKRPPSSTAIARWTATTVAMNPFGSSFTAVNAYSPGNNCNYTPYMPDQGFHEHIGWVPNWDAQYISSGGNPALLKTVEANARAANSYGIAVVDSTNCDPIKIADFPNWAGDGVGGSGGIRGTGRQVTDEPLIWELAHCGSMGYTAYLFTADYIYLETCQMNANAVWLQESTLHGSGTSRYLNVQNRAQAWAIRNLSQIAAIYPDDMVSLFGDTQALLGNLITAAHVKYVETTLPAPWLGLMDFFNSRTYTDLNILNGRSYDGELTAGFAPFEHNFTSLSVGMAHFIEPLSGTLKTKLTDLADYVLNFPVWVGGGVGSSEFSLSAAGSYTLNVPISTAQTGTFEAVPISLVTATTPADIYRATFKRPYRIFPGRDDTASYFTTLNELPCDAAVYNPTTLASPITITYHRGTSGNGYLTGFPSVAVTVTESNTVSNTYSAGAQVPFVNDAVISFAGIRANMFRYAALPDDGSQFTITATTAPVSTGANPAVNTLLGSSGGDPTNTNGYWGQFMTALAIANDFGKTGAQAVWDRITATSNYTDINVTANYADTPTFGLAARTTSQPALSFTAVDTGGSVATPGPSIIMDSVSLLSTGIVMDSNRGPGILGPAIPTIGSQPHPLLNDIDVSDPVGTEYAYEVTTVPLGLTSFVVNADGSITASGPDGLHIGAQTTKKNGVWTTDVPLTIQIGTPTSTVTGVTVTPSSVTASGTVSAVVNGSGSPLQSVSWTATGGATVNSSGAYTLPAQTTSPQSGQIIATSTQDGSHSGFATWTVAAIGTPTPTVTSVTVTPGSATVAAGTSQTFTATANGTNSPPQGVTWTCDIGSVVAGVWTAPAATGSIQTATITATSTFNGVAGTATATVPAAASTVTGVTVTPGVVTLTAGVPYTFAATVSGAYSPSQGVTWATTAGSVDSSGTLTPPAATGVEQIITVTARSTQNNNVVGTAIAHLPAAVDSQAPSLSGALSENHTYNSITVSFLTTTSSDNVGIARREFRINGGAYAPTTTSNESSKSRTFQSLASDTDYAIDMRCVDTSGLVSAPLSITVRTNAAPTFARAPAGNGYHVTYTITPDRRPASQGRKR